MIKKLIKIARIDHWIKNLFIIPGVVLALFFLPNAKVDIVSVIFAILATCFTASANYILNEYLDRNFDKYHPTKKNRTLVTDNIKLRYIIIDYLVFALIGLLFAKFVNIFIVITEIWLLAMGLLYNVQPIRTKDIALLDTLSESINNIIRLFAGWFAITTSFLPPSSIILGYWMVGAFLMNTKRYAEYMSIENKEDAMLYRKSFKYYTEHKLLYLSIFYSIMAVLFCGIFIIKYRVELVLIIPFIAAIFCYYISLSYKEDSAVAKPEKLYKEKKLMVLIILAIIVGICLLNIDIPELSIFLTHDLIKI